MKQLASWQRDKLSCFEELRESDTCWSLLTVFSSCTKQRCFHAWLQRIRKKILVHPSGILAPRSRRPRDAEE